MQHGADPLFRVDMVCFQMSYERQPRCDGQVAESLGPPMIADCAMAWAQPEQPPQCLMVVASRVPRLAWKYEAIAYRLSLLDAGVALAVPVPGGDRSRSEWLRRRHR